MDPFYLALLLYVGAVVLAFVDLFVPSGGILLVIAVALALGSVLFGFRSGTVLGMGMLTLVCGSVPVFVLAAIKIWPNTPIGRRIILGPPKRAEESSKPKSARDELIGTVVVSEYPLMPSGQVTIGGTRYNATAKSGMIEAGQRVEVVGISDRNLVVFPTTRKITDTHEKSGDDPQPDKATKDASENLLDLPANELGLDSID